MELFSFQFFGVCWFFSLDFDQDLQLWEIPSCFLDSISILRTHFDSEDTIMQVSCLVFGNLFFVLFYEMLQSLSCV